MQLNRFCTTFYAKALFRSVSWLTLTHVSNWANGSNCTTSFISDSTLTLGLSAQPVWNMSDGLAFAIAPIN